MRNFSLFTFFKLYTNNRTLSGLQGSSAANPTEKPAAQSVTEERSEATRLMKTAKSLIHQKF
jgi:hypothetical protein